VCSAGPGFFRCVASQQYKLGSRLRRGLPAWADRKSGPSALPTHAIHGAGGGSVGGRRLPCPRGLLDLASLVHLLDLAHGVLVHGASVGPDVGGRGPGDCYREFLLGGHGVLYTTTVEKKKRISRSGGEQIRPS
jgi:hypothetical protein